MSGLLGDIFIPKKQLDLVYKYLSYVFQLALLPGIALFSVSQGKEENLSPFPSLLFGQWMLAAPSAPGIAIIPHPAASADH